MAWCNAPCVGGSLLASNCFSVNKVHLSSPTSTRFVPGSYSCQTDAFKRFSASGLRFCSVYADMQITWTADICQLEVIMKMLGFLWKRWRAYLSKIGSSSLVLIPDKNCFSDTSPVCCLLDTDRGLATLASLTCGLLQWTAMNVIAVWISLCS